MFGIGFIVSINCCQRQYRRRTSGIVTISCRVAYDSDCDCRSVIIKFGGLGKGLGVPFPHHMCRREGIVATQQQQQQQHHSRWVIVECPLRAIKMQSAETQVWLMRSNWKCLCFYYLFIFFIESDCCLFSLRLQLYFISIKHQRLKL